jgi:hypothetical protein
MLKAVEGGMKTEGLPGICFGIRDRCHVLILASSAPELLRALKLPPTAAGNL